MIYMKDGVGLYLHHLMLLFESLMELLGFNGGMEVILMNDICEKASPM